MKMIVLSLGVEMARLMPGAAVLALAACAPAMQSSSPTDLDWAAGCRVDQVSVVEVCTVANGGYGLTADGGPLLAGGPMVGLAVNYIDGRGPMVRAGANHHPGRPVTIRFDDDASAFTFTSGDIRPDIVARMRTATVARFRYTQWPSDPESVWVDVTGFATAYDGLF